MLNLINEEALKTLCLNRPATDELTAQVINNLKAITDPLVRYATARTLKTVFDAATEDAGAAAVAHCLEHQIGMDGAHFQHDGLTFSLDYKCEFDYPANDTDREGNPAGYRIALAQVKSDEKQLAISKRDLKNAKDKIELAHPRMAPINPKWTMKYYQKET